MSCTAEIETDLVKDAVAVPMQSVTIRTGETNLSPEEIEKRKAKGGCPQTKATAVRKLRVSDRKSRRKKKNERS